MHTATIFPVQSQISQSSYLHRSIKIPTGIYLFKLNIIFQIRFMQSKNVHNEMLVWKKRCATHVTDKQWTSLIYKELLQINKTKTTQKKNSLRVWRVKSQKKKLRIMERSSNVLVNKYIKKQIKPAYQIRIFFLENNFVLKFTLFFDLTLFPVSITFT